MQSQQLILATQTIHIRSNSRDKNSTAKRMETLKKENANLKSKLETIGTDTNFIVEHAVREMDDNKKLDQLDAILNDGIQRRRSLLYLGFYHFNEPLLRWACLAIMVAECERLFPTQFGIQVAQLLSKRVRSKDAAKTKELRFFAFFNFLSMCRKRQLLSNSQLAQNASGWNKTNRRNSEERARPLGQL